MDFDFIKDQYLFELERKNQLRTSLNLPTGVLIVLGSLLGFFTKEFPYNLSTVITIIFFFFFATSTILFLIAVYHLIRSFYGRTYAFIETPGELKTYYDELLQHHRNLSDYYKSLEEYYGVEPREKNYPEPEELAEQDFQEFLSQKYISAGCIRPIYFLFLHYVALWYVASLFCMPISISQKKSTGSE